MQNFKLHFITEKYLNLFIIFLIHHCADDFQTNTHIDIFVLICTNSCSKISMIKFILKQVIFWFEVFYFHFVWVFKINIVRRFEKIAISMRLQ